MPKYRLVLQRFPYGSVEHSPCVTWLMKFVAKADPRFELLLPAPLDDTPITMTRNRSIEVARALEADFLMMIDSDMAPDCELGQDVFAKPFFPTSIDFMLQHHGPCAVAAPYCGPPPNENIYVFNWQNMETNGTNDLKGMKLGQFSREHAYQMKGIHEVAALATGLIIFDMRGFDKIEPPYFSYEYEKSSVKCDACHQPKRGIEAAKASTEDVVTTRDLSIGGVPQYCNFDAWAGHRKMKTVRKPQPFTSDGVAAKMHDALLKRLHSGSRVAQITPHPRDAEAIRKAEADFDANESARKLLDQGPKYPEDHYRGLVQQHAELFNGDLLTEEQRADLLVNGTGGAIAGRMTVNDLFAPLPPIPVAVPADRQPPLDGTHV